MLSLFYFFVITPFHVEATYSGADLSVITFNIQTSRKNGSHFLTCDHNIESVEQNLYTVYEGEKITVVTKYVTNNTKGNVLCHTIIDGKTYVVYFKNWKKEITVEKEKGTVWNCRILAHRDIDAPLYDYYTYPVAFCYMKIHVRQKVAPQTILVNDMELPTVRTNLTEKYVDFIAEYQYADGDVVKVTCVNFIRNNVNLTMEYNMAGIISDESTMDDLSSSKMIGFVTKLNSGHNNSYIICTHTEADDYTKVMLKFIMRTKFSNIVLLNINKIPMRPHLDNSTSNQYRIDYKYVDNQLITVTCEVERNDLNLVVFDGDLVKSSEYIKSERIPNKAEMRFLLSREESNKEIQCCAEYRNDTSAGCVLIHLTAGRYPIEQYPLHIKIPSNGTVMELYNDYKLNVIFYEFEDSETLQLTCGQFVVLAAPGPVLYLQLSIPAEPSVTCETNGCSVSKNLSVTDKNKNAEIVCYLKEKSAQDDSDTRKPDIVHREIRVILRKKVPTTTNSTSTIRTSTTTALYRNAPKPASKTRTDVMKSAHQDTEWSSTLLLGSSIAALVLLAVFVTAFCFMRTRRTKQIIKPPYGDLSNKDDNSTSLHTKENEDQYDLCHYRDHISERDTLCNTPEDVENVNPEDHHYTEIDYSSCKPNISEIQTRNSLVYDEPYVHINVRDNGQH